MAKIQTSNIEQELANILQEEIWKELTAETGQTKADLDQQIIQQIQQIVKVATCNK